MSDSETKKSIRESVLEKIQSGKVRRLPRLYFAFRVFATTCVALLLLVSSALVISFILFSLRESGEQFLLGFGLQGILVFFVLFPWIQVLFTLASLFLLEWLLQGFKLGYRIPLLNIFFGILAVSIVSGVLISATPLHGFLLDRADKDQLPIVGSAYEHIFDAHEDQGVCHGIVTTVNGQEFVMMHNDRDHDPDDGTFTVTPFPGSTYAMPQVGDRVIVFGHPEMGEIKAMNVQVLPQLPPPTH